MPVYAPASSIVRPAADTPRSATKALTGPYLSCSTDLQKEPFMSIKNGVHQRRPAMQNGPNMDKPVKFITASVMPLMQVLDRIGNVVGMEPCSRSKPKTDRDAGVYKEFPVLI
jgi:hypothetical protein